MKIKQCLIPLLCLSFLVTGCDSETVITTHTEQTEISLSWWGNDVRNEYTIEADSLPETGATTSSALALSMGLMAIGSGALLRKKVK